ncbi:hypothetical protein P7C73_g3987, partial [Tremellales sp. Uapishka_1]
MRSQSLLRLTSRTSRCSSLRPLSSLPSESDTSTLTAPLPPPTPSNLHVQHASSSTSKIRFPHPELDPSLGATRFMIKTFDNMTSMVQAFAVVRSVESELGSVLDINVVKDPDTNLPTNMIFITLLRPYNLVKPLHREIPFPPTPTSNHLGGPSLLDIHNVLVSSPPILTEKSKPPTAKSAKAIQFRIEVRHPAPPIKKDGRTRKYLSNRDERQIKEDEDILSALASFDGGFFGGLEGVKEKFAHLAKAAPREVEDKAQLETSVSRARETPGIPVEDTPLPSSTTSTKQISTAYPSSNPSTPPRLQPPPRVPDLDLQITIPETAAEPMAAKKSKVDRLREQAVAAAKRDFLEREAAQAQAQPSATNSNEVEAESRTPVVEKVVELKEKMEGKMDEAKEDGFFGRLFGKK